MVDKEQPRDEASDAAVPSPRRRLKQTYAPIVGTTADVESLLSLTTNGDLSTHAARAILMKLLDKQRIVLQLYAYMTKELDDIEPSDRACVDVHFRALAKHDEKINQSVNLHCGIPNKYSLAYTQGFERGYRRGYAEGITSTIHDFVVNGGISKAQARKILITYIAGGVIPPSMGRRAIAQCDK